MITTGILEMSFEYDMAPTVMISADKKILVNETLSDQGTFTLVIPNHTQQVRIFIQGKLNDTIMQNGKMVRDQMIKIIGAKHQGIVFDETHFLKLCGPCLHHQGTVMPSVYLGYNFPSYLEYKPRALADALIETTVS
jgi:hypothetical protein|tara:strand:- start:156 stop:566 length:411 start_codon:yes stop_codon:yes gene_type:complete